MNLVYNTSNTTLSHIIPAVSSLVVNSSDTFLPSPFCCCSLTISPPLTSCTHRGTLPLTSPSMIVMRLSGLDVLTVLTILSVAPTVIVHAFSNIGSDWMT